MGLQRNLHFYIIRGKRYSTEEHSTEPDRQLQTGDILAAGRKLSISTISLSRRPAQCYAIQASINIEAELTKIIQVSENVLNLDKTCGGSNN
jgi:hypothetical protein